MKMRICNAALGLVLVAGIGAAHAQTTTAQPAETTVNKASKRPLSLAPAKQMTLRKAARANITTTTTTTRRSTTVTRAAPVQRAATVTRTTTRRVVKTAERPPLDLTPVQRTTVYRAIAEEPIATTAPVVIVPAAPRTVVTTPAPTLVGPAAPTIVTTPAPIVAAPVAPAAPMVTERVVTAPPMTQEVVTVPSTTGFGTAVSPGMTVTYRVGAPLPAGIPVYAMPTDVIATAPALRTYGYATVGDRVLVIDPRTNLVVDELTQ